MFLTLLPDHIGFNYVFLIASIFLIYYGANYLINACSIIAKKFGVSDFLIGFTIIGVGTSLPELVVSVNAALRGSSEIALGNIMGSNILNSCFILGITLLFSPIVISRANRKKDIPLNFFISLLLVVLFFLGWELNRWLGGSFLLIYISYLLYSFYYDRKNDAPQEAYSIDTNKSTVGLVLTIVASLAALILGGKLFVENAIGIADYFHISKKIIAVTLVATGTSLPELATSILAAKKGQAQLALGNILGSNISNILLILGISSLIDPLSFSGFDKIDFVFFIANALLIYILAICSKDKILFRKSGIILILINIGYFTCLFLN